MPYQILRKFIAVFGRYRPKTLKSKNRKNKRAMLRSLGGGQIKKKHIKTTAANLKALKIIIIIIIIIIK